jgi:hypothetical protein
MARKRKSPAARKRRSPYVYKIGAGGKKRKIDRNLTDAVLAKRIARARQIIAKLVKPSDLYRRSGRMSNIRNAKSFKLWASHGTGFTAKGNRRRVGWRQRDLFDPEDESIAFDWGGVAPVRKSKSPKRKSKSPKRKSPKRKSPKRKSPKRKTKSRSPKRKVARRSPVAVRRLPSRARKAPAYYGR